MTLTLTQPGSDLTVELDGYIATATICRPPNNYFDAVLISDLVYAAKTLSEQSEARVIVLASEGRHFCAGADFAARSQGPVEGIPHLYDLAVELFSQPLPIVAAIQGAAIGGGLGLALAADFRVGGEHARFAANFARLGFHQGFGLSVTLPRIVGEQRAAQLLMTGRRIKVEEAAHIGLVDRVETERSALEGALDLAEEIAGSAPLAVRSIRKTLRSGLAEEVRSAMSHERAEQERLMKTSDFKEGIRATADRRLPDFNGQ